MNLRQLQTFATVADLGSLSKASDRLRTAQPALSRQIKLLEHSLKATLFTRNGRGMALTDAGQLLLARVGGLMRQLEQVRDDMLSLGQAPSGRVVLGIVPTASCVLAGSVAARVAADYPDISLRIVESYSGHLIDWLHRGEMDLAMVYGASTDLHLRAEDLVRDELVAVAPPGAGLRGRDEIGFDWLLGQPLVLPSRSHGLRLLVEEAAARRRRKLRVVMEADSFRVLTDMVERGLGATVLPPSSIGRELAQGRLEAASLSRPKIARHMVLALPSDGQPSLATQAVAQVIRAEVAAAAAAGLWRPPLQSSTGTV